MRVLERKEDQSLNPASVAATHWPQPIVATRPETTNALKMPIFQAERTQTNRGNHRPK